MSAWVAVAAAGLGSFVFRISMVLLVGKVGSLAAFERLSRFVVPAAFAALATGAVVKACAGVGFAAAVPPIGAVAAAAIAARRTGSAPAAILAGMPTLWLATALLAG
jgi:branched-subunit amino acid transport protein